MRRLIFIPFLFISSMGWCGASYTDGGGGSDNISMGNVNSVTNRDCSWGAWTKTKEDAGTDGVIGKKNGLTAATAGYLIYQDATDNYNAITADGSTLKTCKSTNDYDDQWVYTLAVWSGSTGLLTMYENDSLSCTTSLGTIGVLTNIVNFTMGNSSGGGAAMSGSIAYGFFVGAIMDEAHRTEMRWKINSYPLNVSVANFGNWFLTDEAGSTLDYGQTNNKGTATGFVSSTDGPPVMYGQGLPL